MLLGLLSRSGIACGAGCRVIDKRQRVPHRRQLHGRRARASCTFRLALCFAFCINPLVQLRADSTGTAFGIGDGFVFVTNYHVIEGARILCLRSPQGVIHNARLVAESKEDDLVLLRSATQVLPLQLAQPGDLERGMTALTIGYPNPTIMGLESKVTEGIVNSLSGLRGNRTTFQFSAPIQPGNSGGPLLTENGDVVGIVASKLGVKYMEATGNIPENVAYAINVARLRALIETTPEVLRTMRPYQRSAPRGRARVVSQVEGSVVLVLASANGDSCRQDGDIESPELNSMPGQQPPGVGPRLAPKLTPSQRAEARRLEREQGERDRAHAAAAERADKERQEATERERMRLVAMKKEEERSSAEEKAAQERLANDLTREARNWRDVSSSLAFVWWTLNYAPHLKDGLRAGALVDQDPITLHQFKAFLRKGETREQGDHFILEPPENLKLDIMHQCGTVEQARADIGYFVARSSGSHFPEKFAAEVPGAWALFTVEKRIGDRVSAISSLTQGTPSVGSRVWAEECR